ncbi:M96 mating-specific protein family [Phytophthora nicotianae]|uniref:M96 mating-specific protein family n=1 Tax=Phytophthora nicotianae TaxID=4792 RepID=A0A0W8B9G9_PHYNI|nr:M96 mating-specific protein family [Phytophthora nicotianae]KUF98401.1 M96 mating-specific protein family [Phytophthora nicotianae]
MSFPLLEDDDEAFTEVLALLDEYNAAVEESPRAHSRSKHASPFSSLAESSAWTAFEAAHPITKTTSKHRNGAREMRRREVQFLRTCVKGLETQLTALKEGAQQRAQLRNATTHSGGQSSALMSVWKDLATRQLDQRLASERENSRLKCAMEDQKKVREMLQRALNTRVARRVAHDDTVCESFGVEIKAPERMADFRIKQVFRRYREADRIVIAWRSYIDPAEFKGQKLEGIRFQEKGSCVIRHPHPTKLHTASNEVTLLRIWHVITPETLANTNGTINSSQFVQDLTDFVLGGSSSASTVQMIENMLIEQSRRNNADCVV